MENTSYRIMYYNGKDVCTYGDRIVFSLPKIRAMAVNPSAASIGVIDKKGRVHIYSCDKQSTLLHKIKDKRKGLKGKPSAISIGYGLDARNMVVGTNLGELLVYDTRDYSLKFVLEGETSAEIIKMSPDNYFIATARGNNIDIWNFETQAMRKQLATEGAVKAISFSTDGSMMATAHANDEITIWNTRTWEPVYTFESDTPVNLSAFNQDDKYLAFVQADENIIILNLRTKEITQSIPDNKGVVNLSFFGNVVQDKNHLLSNRRNEIVYWNTNGLKPFLRKTYQSGSRPVNERMDKNDAG
ncbi:MAG: hypothetical protein LIP01_06860 [Tannerellaceae bacterium]|nr:hypothetical protein [Tannerellaceae bacterium]